MNHSILARIARRYILLIRVGKVLALLPIRIAYALAGFFTSKVTPLRHRRSDFESYAASTGIKPEFREQIWSDILRQQGIFFVNNALHRQSSHSIISRLAGPSEAWNRFIQNHSGALVLTMHHDFHHTLFVLTGAQGKKVNVIAAPEDSGPLAPWLTPYIRQQHADCAIHFNGGHYIFTEHSEAWKIAKALRNGEIVFSLHDFELPGKHSVEARLFDRSFHVSAGSVRIALRLNVPIYFALLLWSPQKSRYILEFHQLDVSEDQPLEAYTQTIARLVSQYPTAWHGWQWLHQFNKIN